MANQLFQQLAQGQSNPNLNIIQMFKAVQNSANPNQLIQQLMSTNPQVSNIMKEIQMNGGDAKSLFYTKAKQVGVDPESILSMLR